MKNAKKIPLTSIETVYLLSILLNFSLSFPPLIVSV